jgi:flagellar biosynthesis/type III secretory pathway protein FliH
LVAGSGLIADEVRSYPDFGVEDDGRGKIVSHDIGGACQAVELESIDFVEFAPLIVLSAAREQAAALTAQAESAAEAIREQARRQGAAEGREDMTRELAPSLIAFANAGQSLIIFEEQLISRYAPVIVQLALDIAEKVIGHAVEVDGRIAESVLQRAKNEVAHARQIRIWLHPDDLKFLAEARPDLLRVESTGGRTIEIVGALDVGRGGCRLETESGIVDATLPTQLDEIRRQLLDDDRIEGSG